MLFFKNFFEICIKFYNHVNKYLSLALYFIGIVACHWAFHITLSSILSYYFESFPGQLKIIFQNFTFKNVT